MPLFRQGPSCLLFIQLLYNSAFITDCLGRPREGGSHPRVLECILSSGSFGTIAMGSQAELPYRGSDNKQLPIFSFCSRQQGVASSHVFLSSRWSGGGCGFCKILTLNRQSQYAVKQGGWGHQLVDPRWIAPKPWTTSQWLKVTCSCMVSLSSTMLPTKGWRSGLLGRLSFSIQYCRPLA